MKIVIKEPEKETAAASTEPVIVDGVRYYQININPRYLNTATDLSIAKTILHESIHAFLLASYFHEPELLQLNYPQLVEEWIKAKYPSELLNIHHEAIVRSFVADLAVTLKKYGELKGYDLQDQFYEDLAWGGLTSTKAYSELSYSVRKRIEDVILIELKGEKLDTYKVKPKGTRLDCY